jgi:hypothetical protein
MQPVQTEFDTRGYCSGDAVRREWQRAPGSRGDARSSAEMDACCSVCGSRRVECDAVIDACEESGADVLHLAECQRCEHRWTWRAAPLEIQEEPRTLHEDDARASAHKRPRVTRGRREVASAA